MFNLKQIISATVIATATLTTAPAVFADNDERIYQQNKAQYISKKQAGQIAQKQIKNSKVKKVEFDHDSHYGATFDVELVNAQGMEYDVKVNAKTGKIIAQDHDDRDDHHDRDDHDD